MLALAVILGALALIASAGLTAFTIGEAGAIVIAVIVLAAVVAAFTVLRTYLWLIVLGLAVVFIATVAYGGYSAYAVYQALSDNSGPVDPADAAALASANNKIDANSGKAGFRVEIERRRSSRPSCRMPSRATPTTRPPGRPDGGGRQ